MQSLLSGTGQVDTLRRARVWFAFAFLSSVVALFGRTSGSLVALSASTGFFLFVGVGIAVAITIRCPKCRTRWFFYALRSQPVGQWLFWLKSFSTCPKCGFSRHQECADAGSRHEA